MNKQQMETLRKRADFGDKKAIKLLASEREKEIHRWNLWCDTYRFLKNIFYFVVGLVPITWFAIVAAFVFYFLMKWG